MKKNIVYSIASASIALSFLTLMSKGIGFVREMMYAKTFGLSYDYDLFLSSTALISVINIAFIFLIQHYFIPAYNRLKYETPENGDDFLNYTLWWSIIFGIILSIFLYLFAKPLLYYYQPGINQAKLDMGIKIFSIFLLTIPVNNGIAVISAYMQAKFRFIYPAASQIMLNIIVIILVYFFFNKIKIFILPIGFILANVIAFIILVIPVLNIVRFNFTKLFQWKKGIVEIDKIIYLFIIEFLSLSYVLVDRYFIASIPPGGLAAMNYAIVVFALPISIISIPLNTILFSRFSRDYILSTSTMKSDFLKSMKINNFIIMPLGFIMYFWGGPFLRIFFQRGAFDSYSTFLTFQVLKFYTAGLVFYSGYLIFVKLFYSINRYRTVMWLSIAAFFLKIILNIIFIDKYFQDGMAFSTSLIYLFLFVAGYYFLNRLYIKENVFIAIYQVLYCLINGFISYLVATMLVSLFGPEHDYLKIFVSLFLFILIYGLNSNIIGDKEVVIISSPLYSLMKKIRGLLSFGRAI
jgi:putative peptidoglycan lipid II flippase